MDCRTKEDLLCESRCTVASASARYIVTVESMAAGTLMAVATLHIHWVERPLQGREHLQCNTELCKKKTQSSAAQRSVAQQAAGAGLSSAGDVLWLGIGQ